jgi:hypothetical protein
VPSPFLPTPPFPLPPPDVLSKLLQTLPPPLPLPVPAPVDTLSPKKVNDDDLYDPLKAEDDDDDDNNNNKAKDTSKEIASTVSKASLFTFNIKKEPTIKMEPGQSCQHLSTI